MHELLTPSLFEVGADETARLFTTETTHNTLIDISGLLNSRSFSTMAHRYRTQGAYFDMTDDGLVLSTEPSNTAPGRCPYVNTSSFINFADHIVETYAEAHRRDMPYGWLDAINKSLRRSKNS